MSLTRQIWWLLAGLLVLTLAGSVVTHTVTTQRALQAQLQLRNDGGAILLAQAMSQQRGDLAQVRRLAEAQFDTGHYRHLRLRADDGRVLYERDWQAPVGGTPDWFAALLPFTTRPGSAPVSDGARRIGAVEVSSQAAWAIDELWMGCVQMTAWLLATGLLAAVLAGLALRRWQRALDATVAQAEALQERRYVLAEEGRVPELQRLTRGMNALVRRMQAVFDAQAVQLESLRKQAQLDPATGLLARRAFVGAFEQARARRPGTGGSMLLVRLCALQALNKRIGRDAADRLLAAVAQVLQSYPAQVRGALAGRLNAADFALFLPAPGLAAETATSLADALQAALSLIDREVDLRIGAVEVSGEPPTSAVFAAADQALARAECDRPFAVQVAAADLSTLGEEQWRARLAGALDAGRVELGERPLRRAGGELLHLECPLRLQLEPGGAYLPAAQWSAMVVRCNLTARVDLAALDLALSAIHADGVARGIEVSTASLATPGFFDEVQRRLDAAPLPARALSIDLGESAAARAPAGLRTAIGQWRRQGVRVGVGHGGGALRGAARLHELGLDHVKLDRGFVEGVARDATTRELVRGLITLLRGMQLGVLAEGVDDAADLDMLWMLGVEGASGAASKSPAGRTAAAP